jgi:hypothetical protein
MVFRFNWQALVAARRKMKVSESKPSKTPFEPFSAHVDEVRETMSQS